MGYVVIVAVSVAVGVAVYRLTARMPIREDDQHMWLGRGAAPVSQAPPPPPTNFERLSITRDRLTWHDRIVGSLGLIVAVALGAATLAFALYLAGSTLIGLLKQAAESSP